MACKVPYTLFSCSEFGLPVVAFDGVEHLCNDAFFLSLCREMMLNILFCHTRKNEALGYKQVPQNDEKPIYKI